MAESDSSVHVVTDRPPDTEHDTPNLSLLESSVGNGAQRPRPKVGSVVSRRKLPAGDKVQYVSVI